MDTAEMTAQEIKDTLDAGFYKAVHTKFMYIPESGQLINKNTGKVAGCLTSNGYLVVSIGPRPYPAHRLIYYMYHGHFPKGQIDHINRIKTDNRIANLRDVSASKNMRNTGNSTKNKSGVKGVIWNRQENCWQAKAFYKRKPIHVGNFKHFINAVKARHYAEQIFGYTVTGMKSPAEKYLDYAKKMTFQTNIKFEREKPVGKNSVESEWNFFCYERKKVLNKIAEEA